MVKLCVIIAWLWAFYCWMRRVEKDLIKEKEREERKKMEMEKERRSRERYW